MTADMIRPETTDDLLTAMAEAVAAERTLEIAGTGSKSHLGRPVTAEKRVDMSACAGITLYEPEELVMTAKAGTRLAEIESALAEHGQYFAFEPLDLGPLYGNEVGAGTLGGLVATGMAGPRRIAAGAVRDHVLGLKIATGHATLVKTGGRVVKNVTGYDVSKLMTGACGTLGILTDITLKVMPAPETEVTLVLEAADGPAALPPMRRALAGNFSVSGAAWLPGWAAGDFAAGPSAFLRLEGFAVSVDARAEALVQALSGAGAVTRLEDAQSRAFWRHLRGLGPALARPENDLWRISLPPAEAAEVMTALTTDFGADCWLDWAGGLVWCLVAPGQESAFGIRDAAERAGGHATALRRADAAIEPFHPLPVAKLALTRRIKESFDPTGIINPGRMYEGI